MNENTIAWGLKAMPILSAVLLFLLLVGISRRIPSGLWLDKYAQFRGFVREKNKSSNWYRRTQEKLIQNGAAFHYGKWLQPAGYMALRLILALSGFTALCGISVGYGVLAAAVLFSLPGWLLHHMNRQDNIRMLPEIKLIYHALELQIRAGVYVTDALAECYGSVQEPRLRQALLELAGDIVMKADILDALEKFQSKFDNRYIDSLCITILQALESGQAVELLGDIAEQIKDMEGAVMEQKKGALDRSITFYQLGVLTAVMGIVLYACVTHMYTSAMRF